MIERLKGKVVEKDKGSIVLDVNSVGYRIFSPAHILESISIEAEITVLCYQHVTETTLDLYGFLDEEERNMFKMLISISGVGPKSALSVLDTADLSELKQAIASEDPEILTRVSGIGPKLAGRIVLELKNKLIEGYTETLSSDLDIIEGLTALGFTQSQAREALKGVEKTITDPEQRLESALKILGKNK
jgi:Holliday junction DNA helicase RuvA